jgi:hypothetical protein
MDADLLPSAMPSWTAPTAKVAEDWPAGMVIVAGTVAALGLVLARLTTKALLVSVLRVTVTVVADDPAFSATVWLASVTVR